MLDIRQQIKDELSKISVQDMIIIDWGSGGRKVERYIHHSNCEIISVDSRERRQPTLVADMCKPVVIKKADIAFCLETLEHCYDVNIAIDNIFNNLKVNGKLYISVPFVCPVHARWDYWRFTSLGIKTLLEQHSFKVLRIIEKIHDSRIGYFIEAIK